MNKCLEWGLIKSDYIFYKTVISRWSVGFTKPMIDYEILVNSKHKLLITHLCQVGLLEGANSFL